MPGTERPVEDAKVPPTLSGMQAEDMVMAAAVPGALVAALMVMVLAVKAVTVAPPWMPEPEMVEPTYRP